MYHRNTVKYAYELYTDNLIRFGASYIIDTSNTPLLETVKALNNGRDTDAAIDLFEACMEMN